MRWQGGLRRATKLHRGGIAESEKGLKVHCSFGHIEEQWEYMASDPVIPMNFDYERLFYIVRN
jgi:hypothetical protein